MQFALELYIQRRPTSHVHLDMPRSRRSRSERCVVETRRVEVLSPGTHRRDASGTEVLEGGRGTLTLRWTTEQVQRDGRWGEISGHWFVVGASGLYSGRYGHGELSADQLFRITTYRGLLVTAL